MTNTIRVELDPSLTLELPVATRLGLQAPEGGSRLPSEEK